MTGRAMELLTVEHLRHLGRLADEDRQGMFARNPHLEVYRDRLLCVVLCQGGALHFIDGVNGVKDLDVWSFYAAGPFRHLNPRRRATMTYKDSGLTGWTERVDILSRSIEMVDDTDPAASVLHYLRTGPTVSAMELAKKAVVLIEPAFRIGEVVWPE